MTNPLSTDHLNFFRDNGYLILRGVLDPALMAQARDSWWAAAPPELVRDDPETWVGAFADSRWTWKYREAQDRPWLIDLLAGNATLRAAATQLLGPELEAAERVRGIYLVFPEGDVPERPVRLHVDQHPFHLGAVAYIDDVPPGGGGFTVWPGSHKRFYPTFRTAYTFNPVDTSQEFREQPAWQEVSQQEPVGTYGRAGDVVLWHHRLGHSAGHNRSRQVRQAVLYDFKRTDLAAVQDEPTPDNMWRDWPGIIEAAG